jgi:hypothetical protein
MRKASILDVESYAWFSLLDMGHRKKNTTTYVFGAGPPGLEGPVRQPSSNPPRDGPEKTYTIKHKDRQGTTVP